MSSNRNSIVVDECRSSKDFDRFVKDHPDFFDYFLVDEKKFKTDKVKKPRKTTDKVTRLH